VLIIFLDVNFKVKVPQSVVEILAVHICASPKGQRKDLKREYAKKNTTKESKISLPAFQRWDVEMFMIKDQCDASLGMVHVVLGSKPR
jgi:hypothetical protein